MVHLLGTRTPPPIPISAYEPVVPFCEGSLLQYTRDIHRPIVQTGLQPFIIMTSSGSVVVMIATHFQLGSPDLCSSRFSLIFSINYPVCLKHTLSNMGGVCKLYHEKLDVACKVYWLLVHSLLRRMHAAHHCYWEACHSNNHATCTCGQLPPTLIPQNPFCIGLFCVCCALCSFLINIVLAKYIPSYSIKEIV